MSRPSTRLCLGLLSALVTLALFEGFFRLVDYDFADDVEAWWRAPPYFRKPIVPTGEVFFRRPGPEEWTGQVLNTMLEQEQASPNPYRDEPVITVKYDRFGFRNEQGFSDWEVAVAGDSFTELGYLAYDQLFTTILGKTLKVRVLNLGASYTASLTQLSYLRDYGVAPSTRHAMIVFFEGNDISGLRKEYDALLRFQETGRREYRVLQPQTSMIRAACELLKRNDDPPLVTGTFRGADGVVPITLGYMPPEGADLEAENVQALEYFFERYAEFGRKRGLTVWLAFMPCKDRVLHGHVVFAKDAPRDVQEWRPTDLPAMIEALSDRSGVRFIDLTPVLVAETQETRELVFNPIYDSHINARGSLVVAGELARHLSEDIQSTPAR